MHTKDSESTEETSYTGSLYVYKKLKKGKIEFSISTESSDFFGYVLVANMDVIDNNINNIHLHKENKNTNITRQSAASIVQYIQTLPPLMCAETTNIFYPREKKPLDIDARIIHKNGSGEYVAMIKAGVLKKTKVEQWREQVIHTAQKSQDTKDTIKTRFYKFKDGFLSNKPFAMTNANNVDITVNTLTDARNIMRDKIKAACDAFDHSNPDVFKQAISELKKTNNAISKHFGKSENTGRVNTMLDNLLNDMKTIEQVHAIVGIPMKPLYKLSKN